MIVAIADRLVSQVRPKYEVAIEQRIYQTVTVPLREAVQQRYLKVRDVATGQGITAIAILSPVHKRAGEDRQDYLHKRDRILNSATHLVELDLLRAGPPMPLTQGSVSQNYRILVSPGPLRPQAHLYACSLAHPLPTIAIPLALPDEGVWLNLQALVEQVYDRAGFDYRIDSRIDYRQAPSTP